MRILLSKILLSLLVALLSPAPVVAAVTQHADTTQTRYDRRASRYRSKWGNLIPTQSLMQFAGNMGLVSIGTGWDYGRRKQWETHLFIGYLPRYQSSRSKATITLKENFLPWSRSVGSGWSVQPFTASIYLNTILGGEFWGKSPQRYPDKYYESLSTKVRVNVAVGQRITRLVSENRGKLVKDVSLFYEVGTCDLFLRSFLQDSSIGLGHIFSISIGIKTQLL